MSKLVTAMFAIALLALPTLAAAEEGLATRLQTFLACETISSDEARLRCYDQSIVPLKQALSHGSVVLKENKGPRTLEGVVKASGKTAEKSFWVMFENGDRWAITTQPDRRAAPLPGTTLKLRRTIFGNYWIKGPGWRDSEAVFLGNES